jgi:hypothetical protein
MKTWFVPVALLSLVACRGSTQSPAASAPASPRASAEATPDAGSEPAPTPIACESATACDTCLAIDACNWTGDRCLASCLADTSCFGPGNPSAPRCPDVAAAPAAPPLVGAHTIAFRAGPRPPVGVLLPHGATGWAVTLAASAGPSPELTALFASAQGAHLAASVGDVACTPAVGGAYPATMPTGDGAQALTVTFRSERDARRFAAALTEAPLRIGRARVMCAD